VYPPDQTGEIVAGSIKQRKKRTLNDALLKRSALFKQAVDLGLPKYLWRTITVKDLEEFIQKHSAMGQKEAGNTAPEIDAIVEKASEPSVETLMNRFSYRLTQYKRTGSPHHIPIIGQLANTICEMDSTKTDRIKYQISVAGLRDEIDW
jgi:hypothetical protein